MERNELKTLIKGALLNETVPGVNFSDTKQVVINELMASMGIDSTMSVKQMRRYLDYSIVEEVIDEILPVELENILGSFAEIKRFARDEEVVFTLKGLGKRRAMYGISYGARGGIYKARRLDERSFGISTKVYTCAVYVTLEEILLGKYTLGELMSNILEGMQYIVYAEIVKALRTVKTMAPAANSVIAEGFSQPAMDQLIKVVGAYGKPVILAFHDFAAKINNIMPLATVSRANPIDIEEYRNKGAVSLYKGVQVVELPNFLVDESNEEFAFDESQAFVIPAGEKPVYVAFKGEGYIKENEHPTGSAEEQFHQMMGVGILLYNNIGVYTDSALVSATNKPTATAPYAFKYKF